MNNGYKSTFSNNYNSTASPEYGLTKREYFAAMAMQALITKSVMCNRDIAISALNKADALLKELEK